MEVRFWGTRGAIPTPGPHTVRFGGNTSCVEVRTAEGHIFIFDCGTGARPLGEALMAPPVAPVSASILFSHTHWDHIQGFPFFAPAFEPRNTIAVYGPEGGRRSLHDTLARQMELSYFPVELSQLPATLSYTDLGEGAHTIGGARIVAQYLNHPAVTLGYRVEADGAAVVYACDHEPFGGALWRTDAAPGPLESILHEGDRRHAHFLADADLVIHDAQYTPEEYRWRKSWGHSTFEHVVELARTAGVKRLALTHHDPSHDDAVVAESERRARAAGARRPGRPESPPRRSGDGLPPGPHAHVAVRRGQHARGLRRRRDRLSDQALLEPTAQRPRARVPHARTEALSRARGPLYPLRSYWCLLLSRCPLALRLFLARRLLLPLRLFRPVRFFLSLRLSLALLLFLAPVAAPVLGAPDLRQLVLSDHQPGHRRRFGRLGKLRILRRIRPRRRRKAKEACGGNEAVTPHAHRSLSPHHRHLHQDVGQGPLQGPCQRRIGHSIVSYRSRHGIERQACRNAGKVANCWTRPPVEGPESRPAPVRPP